MKLCYYGEFDPFSGIPDDGPASLATVLTELKVLCLLDDAIVVPPANLVQHPLALPACEALAPFVRAGRLTTSTAPSSPGPHAYIAECVALHREARVPGRDQRRPVVARRPRTRGRQRALTELTDRWCRLLPDRWFLKRDIAGQISGSTDRVRRFCEEGRISPEAARRILRFIDGQEPTAGSGVNRESLMAFLAAVRAEVAPRDVSAVALVTQAAYFSMGAVAHACTLFPGRFARLARDRAASLPPGAMPPYDWQADPGNAAARLRELGLDLTALLALDAEALFAVATSPEWLAVREVLGDAAPGPDAVRAAVEPFRRAHQARRTVVLVTPGAERAEPRLSLPSRAPVLLPTPWQLAIQGVLGTRIEETPRAGAVVDLHTLQVRDPASDEHAHLTRCQMNLLSLLAVHGAAGVDVQDAKQLLFEIGLLAGASSPPGAWRPQERESVARDRALGGWIHVLKARINGGLAHVGLVIETEHGRIRVVDKLGAERSLGLAGGVWEPIGDALPLPDALPRLAAQQAALWRVLVAAFPHHVSLPALALAIGKPPDKHGLEQTTDAIYKLHRALESQATPWRVSRLQRGLYRIVPSPGPARGEVG